MSKKSTLWVLIALLLAISGGLIVLVQRNGATGASSNVPSPLVGKEAPQFTLPLLGTPDKTFSSADLAQHSVAVVNVWASWCAPCRAEMPVLQQLQQAMPNLPIYGLVFKDDAASAQGFLQQVGNPFTLSMLDADGRAGIEWGVYGVPETYVVQTRPNAQGVPTVYIVDKHIGAITADQLRDKFMPLLQRLSSGETVVAP